MYVNCYGCTIKGKGNNMKAYKFLKDDCKSGKGNEPAWKEGETRTLDGEIEMCVKGYHASPSWLDALGYAPGSIACIVDLKNPIKDDDKWVSNTCTIIKMVDASKALRTFACDCAERALKLNNVTNERSWNAITVSRLYNEGKATKGELADARGAAMDAAREAAMDAERAWQKQHLNKLMKQLLEGK